MVLFLQTTLEAKHDENKRNIGSHTPDYVLAEILFYEEKNEF